MWKPGWQGEECHTDLYKPQTIWKSIRLNFKTGHCATCNCIRWQIIPHSTFENGYFLQSRRQLDSTREIMKNTGLMGIQNVPLGYWVWEILGPRCLVWVRSDQDMTWERDFYFLVNNSQDIHLHGWLFLLQPAATCCTVFCSIVTTLTTIIAIHNASINPRLTLIT